ncbi:MAG TPA: hypothetical protein VJZ71_17445 [Phycisphaerae bacterium]|nr:hypothetical protein [Phycisphaerae bacterium]
MSKKSTLECVIEDIAFPVVFSAVMFWGFLAMTWESLTKKR